MNWANYLIQINLYLMLFYAFYLLFLRNETFFTLNRMYLLGSAFFSALIPLIQTEWVKSFFITEKAETGWQNINVMMMGFASPIKEDTSWTLGDFITLIYLAGVLILLIKLFWNLMRVKQMFHSENHPEAFSFFRKIRVNENLPQKAQIEKHEQTHAQQLHSADVLFFEILSIINWFNPVVYLYQKAIRQIHEFIADEKAIAETENKKEYALLLFSKSFGINPNALTNNFFNQSLLKRRIQMLQKPKSRKAAILKYGLSAPLFLLAMILSSATISKSKVVKVLEKKVEPKHEISSLIIPELKVEKHQKPTINKVLEQNDAGDFKDFKKFLKLNLRYPTEARKEGEVAKIALEFTLDNNKNIKGVKALNFADSPFAAEGERVINLYKEKLNTAPGTYTIVMNFMLQGDNIKKDTDTDFDVLNNYLGEITIMAYMSSNNTTQDNQDPIFTNVENLPTFPGGIEEFSKFLQENLKYPSEAKKAGIQGRVLVGFIVEKDGSLSNFEVKRGIGSGCDEEAVRVMKLSPKWIPGKQNGRNVRVNYIIPIFFQLGPTPPPPPPAPMEISSDNKALFIINGEEYKGDKNKLNTDLKAVDIESINVLKGETAVKKYGDKGKDGVIEITTKKK